MLGRRPWHEQESRLRRGVRGLLAAVVGIALPLTALVMVITANTPKPPEQPPPPRLQARSVTADPPADGAWHVAEGSWVGYRILEDIPRLRGKHEAVGRTTAVEGTLVIDGATIVEASVTADMTQLTSDRPWRDRVLRNRYLHTSRHPRASFELAGPLPLLGLPAPGEPADLTVPGVLRLHGVARDVQAPLRVRWDGDAVRVTTVLPLVLADHDISPPRVPGFRFVDHAGDIEVALRFVRPDEAAAGSAP